jgi:cytochrome c biogenesis protein CcdA
MLRHNVGWVLCPVCDAGSPAGVSTCPRCRYQFQIHSAPAAPERALNPPPKGVRSKQMAAEGSAVRDSLLGALWAVLALAGAAAIQGAIVRYKECSATADALSSAMIFVVLYVLNFGIPTLVIGAILGWALGRLGRYASRFRAAKPKAMSDTMLE